MSVRDIDRGARAFMARLEELSKGVPVTVGVHKDDGTKQHAGSEITVGELAVVHEFEFIGGKGTKLGGRKRQRSWMRRTFAKQKKALRAGLGAAAVEFLRGQALAEAFRKPGELLQEAIVDASGEETGQLHQAMTVRVRGQVVASGHGGFGTEVKRGVRRMRKRVGSFFRRIRNRIRGRV